MVSLCLDPENRCSVSGREQQHLSVLFLFFFNGHDDFSQQEAY